MHNSSFYFPLSSTLIVNYAQSIAYYVLIICPVQARWLCSDISGIFTSLDLDDFYLSFCNKLLYHKVSVWHMLQSLGNRMVGSSVQDCSSVIFVHRDRAVPCPSPLPLIDFELSGIHEYQHTICIYRFMCRFCHRHQL